MKFSALAMGTSTGLPDIRQTQTPSLLAGLPKPPPLQQSGGAGLPHLPGLKSDATQLTQQLPDPPPSKKKATAFDNDHYQQTMLALAAGFFGSNNFGDGLGNAAKAIYGQNEAIRKEGRPELGGPDNAFEVYTDPTTGEHTYKPIQAAVDYQNRKRIKAKDVADINGRVMHAISQLPEEQQAASYAQVLANPEAYGVDPETLSATWDPQYAQIIGNMGMTVGQATARKQAAEKAAAVGADRDKRTQIYGDRAAATTRQGDARIGIAQEALGLRKANAGGKGGKGGQAPISGLSKADLANIILGN